MRFKFHAAAHCSVMCCFPDCTLILARLLPAIRVSCQGLGLPHMMSFALLLLFHRESSTFQNVIGLGRFDLKINSKWSDAV